MRPFSDDRPLIKYVFVFILDSSCGLFKNSIGNTRLTSYGRFKSFGFSNRRRNSWFPDIRYFEAVVADRKIVLTPVEMKPVDVSLTPIRAKMEKLGVTPADVAEAVKWARGILKYQYRPDRQQ